MLYTRQKLPLEPGMRKGNNWFFSNEHELTCHKGYNIYEIDY